MLRVRIDMGDEPIGELHIQRDALDKKEAPFGNYTVKHFEQPFKTADNPTRTFRVENFERNKKAFALSALAISQFLFEVAEGR